jgi:hypothetical protein
MLTDSNTILTSYMTFQIMTVDFFLWLGFSAVSGGNLQHPELNSFIFFEQKLTII